MINSRLDLSTAAAPGSGGMPHHPKRHPFSRSCGVILPSSLTMVLPIALVCSTHPPVSVCGTGPSGLPRGFSRKHGMTRFALRLRPPPRPLRKADFPAFRPTRHHGDVQNPAELPFSVTPSVIAPLRGCRNVCLLCIGYAFRPRLSSRLTLGGLALPRKPWVCGGGVSHAALATHASILPPGRSTGGRPPASPLTGCSPTAAPDGAARRFGAMLSPVYCRRMSTRPVSCYALFEWVAASEPTSWLSGQTHILCHLAWTWGPWRAVWAVSLSNTRLSPHILTPRLWTAGIRSLIGVGRR